LRVSQYVNIAERYWKTSLSSQHAAIKPEQRREFFDSLVKQVAEAVEYLAANNLHAAGRRGDYLLTGARRERMARLRAEQEAELVYLPKQPGRRAGRRGSTGYRA
jgi:hypothetical protein